MLTHSEFLANSESPQGDQTSHLHPSQPWLPPHPGPALWSPLCTPLWLA